MKTISEVHRNERQIDSKIELVDDGNENEIKFPAMLQLQRQKVVTMSEQQHFNLSLDKLQKQVRIRTRLLR